MFDDTMLVHGLRAANFVLMIALLLIPYQLMSQAIYTDSLAFIRPVLAVIGG